MSEEDLFKTLKVTSKEKVHQLKNTALNRLKKYYKKSLKTLIYEN